MVAKLLLEAAKTPEHHAYGMLFLLAYSFLLRVPSEALLIGESTHKLCLKDNELVLELKRRKNMPAGSTLRRGCWCKESAETCPVHVLGPFVGSCSPGQKLFDGITPAKALRVLRVLLAAAGIADAGVFARIAQALCRECILWQYA